MTPPTAPAPKGTETKAKMVVAWIDEEDNHLVECVDWDLHRISGGHPEPTGLVKESDLD